MILTCILALAVRTAATASAAEPAKPFFVLREAGKGVWAAIAIPGMHAGGNTGFIVGSDAVAVVDTFAMPEATEQLVAAIREKTPLPIRFVVDTHYHLDHVAGNGVFAKLGATIIAQRNVLAWAKTENKRILFPPVSDEDVRKIADLTLPSLIYDDGVELELGGRKVVVRVMPGHTGGDSVVVVPDAKVVFTGDLFWDHSLPNLIDADTEKQIATLDALATDYSDAAFVPGHGRFLNRPELDSWNLARAPDVTALRDYLSALRQAVKEARDAGKSGAALREAVLTKIRPRFGDWFAFDFFAPKNIEQTEAELAGTKDRPRPAGR
jgi:glyoxylase-like metal-dependent hydrolase (beta-lactamase superfamily II)